MPEDPDPSSMPPAYCSTRTWAGHRSLRRAVEAAEAAAASYGNVEFDLVTGNRGGRGGYALS